MKRSVSRPLGIAIFAASGVVVVVGRAAPPGGRYTISSGTAYDTKTKLTWQQTVPSSTYTQAGAVGYCSSLSLNGATGWRLPTMKELVTLVDFSVASPGPTIDSASFPATPAAYFWSSTLSADASGYAWGVYFYDGTTNNVDASSMHSARCVR